MSVTYSTLVIGEGNHASLAIPDAVLVALGTHRRAPLRVTVNGHTYRSTATAVGGECRVVFPRAERIVSGARAGDTIEVTLTLDDGHRDIDLHPDFDAALRRENLREFFETMSYSHRREYARSVTDAKADETRQRRIAAALAKIRDRIHD